MLMTSYYVSYKPVGVCDRIATEIAIVLMIVFVIVTVTELATVLVIKTVIVVVIMIASVNVVGFAIGFLTECVCDCDYN